MAGVPRYHATPEIRVDCPDEVKFDIIRKVAENFKRDHKVIDVDGARVLFGDGWGLIRASNTQPALVLRAEAKTHRIQQSLVRELERFPEVGAIRW